MASPSSFSKNKTSSPASGRSPATSRSSSLIGYMSDGAWSLSTESVSTSGRAEARRRRRPGARIPWGPGTIQDTSVQPCSLCPILTFEEGDDKHKPTPLEYGKMVFHRECRNCQSEIPYMEPLCQFCSHWRPAHILDCMLPLYCINNPRDLGAKFWETMSLTLGTVDEVKKRTNCTICQSLTKVVARHHLAGKTLLRLNFGTFIKKIAIREDHGTDDLGSVSLSADGKGLLATFQVRNMLHLAKLQDMGLPIKPFEPSIKAGEEVDWKIVRRWVSRCNVDHHTACVPPTLDPQPRGFRLIDVTRNCVVLAPREAPYIALSYVWGVDQRGTVESRRANIASLEKDGALKKQSLPRTVTDAMVATARLGHRYLWVDRLCIVQDDDPAIKKGQIDAMGFIYGSAALTIVGLAGTDAHYGLPGVLPSSPAYVNPPGPARPGVGPTGRPEQIQFHVQGLALAEEHSSLRRLCRNTTWPTRGWTFQEAVLSRRVLYFSDEGVVYECAHEKGQARFEGLSWSHFDSKEPMAFHALEYTAAINIFNKREFTNDADALRAFSGYAHYLFGDEHRAGIPFKEWDFAIMWLPETYDVVTRSQPTVSGRPVTDDDVFPSWSWSSIKGNIEFFHLRKGGSTVAASVASWAFCARDQKNGRTSLFPVRSSPDSLEEAWNTDRYAPETPIMAALAWKEGCFAPLAAPAALPSDVAKALSNGTWNDVHAAVQKRWPTYGSFWEAVRGGAQNPAFLKSFSQDDIREGLTPGRVLVATQTAMLDLEWARGHDWTESDVFKIKSQGGLGMGYIMLGEELGGKLKTKLKAKETVRMEFLALSVGAMWESHLSSLYSEIQSESRDDETILEALAKEKCAPADEVWHFNAKGNRFAPWLLLNVMMVERRGKNLARRLGVGQVYVKRWMKAGPVFKTLVLE